MDPIETKEAKRNFPTTRQGWEAASNGAEVVIALANALDEGLIKEPLASQLRQCLNVGGARSVLTKAAQDHAERVQKGTLHRR